MESSLTILNNNRWVAPVADMQTALVRYQLQKDFIHSIMHEGVDYGKIPGVEKPSLFKPGAEKLMTFFGLSADFQLIDRIEDWDGHEHGGECLFYYRYKCVINNGALPVSACEGSANSHESKYRWRWVQESNIPAGLEKSFLKVQDGRISEFVFAIDKGETSGQYGKPAEYWKQFRDAIAAGTAKKIQKKTRKGEMIDAWEVGAPVYRIPNDDIESLINTLQKMGQKRAYVGAVLLAVNASEYFTQDVEDFMQPNDPTVIEAQFTEPAKAEQKPIESPPPPPSEWPDNLAQTDAPAQTTAELVNYDPLQGKRGVKIGKHFYPAAWAKLLATYKRVNEFEIDGILQQERPAGDKSPEDVLALIDYHLDHKEAK